MEDQKITVVKCLNGHHFNADRYNACPVCGAAMKPMASVEPEDDKQKKHFFNPVGKKERKDEDKKTEKKPDDRTQGKAENLTPPSRLGESDVTGAIFGSNPEPTPVPEPNPVPTPNPDPIYVPQPGPTPAPQPQPQPQPEPTPVPQPNPVPTPDTEPATFNSVVNNAKNGKTQGYFTRKNDTNNNPENTSNNANNDSTSNSGAGNSNTGSTEPPVGWLVCVKGLEFGKAFPIKNGQNTIGRAPSCAIPLLGDGYVSRGVHAKIKYEPIKRKFTLIAGDTSGLTYLNGEDIDVPCELKAYDKISLSAGVADANSYMFVPLCGENFTWEDYI